MEIERVGERFPQGRQRASEPGGEGQTSDCRLVLERGRHYPSLGKLSAEERGPAEGVSSRGEDCDSDWEADPDATQPEPHVWGTSPPPPYL